MREQFDAGLVWFRRDLRAFDHAALFYALRNCKKVYCAFVYDTQILDALPRQDRRVEFIWHAIADLDAALYAWIVKAGVHTASPGQNVLLVRHGLAQDELPRLAHALGVQAVFANHDDEPQSRLRDNKVRGHLADSGIAFKTFKDHVIFERHEVVTQMDRPFTVFTPYKNAWLKKVNAFFLKPYPVAMYAHHLAMPPPGVAVSLPSLAAIGFEATNLLSLKMGEGATGGERMLQNFWSRIDHYDTARNFPSIKGPSYLGVHLRFGTVSIRQLVAASWQLAQTGNAGAEVWLSELIWRDFYAQILANYPHVVGASFKPAYDNIRWEKGALAKKYFEAWTHAQTGYPLVDAAMLQLNTSGYMHNRLRMVTASFLCKHLGLDWRLGEAYFAEKLNDFDLASNNGGWQWASSSGCDAQPYFRIFNPTLQSEKFDAEGKFIKRYLPVLGALPSKFLHAPWLADGSVLSAAGVKLGSNYPTPIVDHAQARSATLDRYAAVKA